MGVRLTCRGGDKLGSVVASVVERLGRASGLLQEDARLLASSTRKAWSRARKGALPTARVPVPSGCAAVEVEVARGDDPREACVTAHLRDEDPVP